MAEALRALLEQLLPRLEGRPSQSQKHLPKPPKGVDQRLIFENECHHRAKIMA